MYDSFLYGNGLTLALLNQVKKANKNSFITDKYLDFNVFFEDFIQAKEHKKILRDYNKYFDLRNNQVINTHEEVRNYLRKHTDSICSLGFERWVSKSLFDKNDAVPENVKTYVYLVYNYWYHIINKDILSKPTVLKTIEDVGHIIQKELNSTKKIYTLNFDTILDFILRPQHLHGIFSLPLKNIKNIILHSYNNKEFEYIYLFGAGGLEKKHRLSKINEFRLGNQDKYDLDFFFNQDMHFGHLLIYGVSFSNTEYMSQELLSKYPNYKNNFFIRSVDGHILERLNNLFLHKRVDKITIAYYSQNDLRNYNQIIGFTDFNKIVEYKHCDEVFNLNCKN